MQKRKSKPSATTTTLSVRIEQSVMDALKAAAKKRDQPFPYFIRRLLGAEAEAK